MKHGHVKGTKKERKNEAERKRLEAFGQLMAAQLASMTRAQVVQEAMKKPK